MNTARLTLCVAVIACLCGQTQVAWSQISRSRAAGAVAAIEAQRNAEAQRRAAVEAQIAQNRIQGYDTMPWAAPYGRTIYYRPVYPNYYGAYGYVPYAGFRGSVNLGGPTYGYPYYSYYPYDYYPYSHSYPSSIYAGSTATSYGSPVYRGAVPLPSLNPRQQIQPPRGVSRPPLSPREF